MGIRVIGHKVAVKMDKSGINEKKSGILLLNNTDTSVSEKGLEVISVGSKAKDKYRVGDRIVFDKKHGEMVTVDGQKYLIVRSGDILGKV